MCLLLIVYFVEPSLDSPAALAAAQNQRILAWLPSYWFLALFNQLNGSMHPVLVPLARRAWIGLGVSALGACTALVLCYFRLMRRMVEQPDILPQTRFVSWSLPFSDSLTGAITCFSMRTLLRSRQHRMILSFYLGIGITIVVGYVKATNRGLGSTRGTISNSFLFASILMMVLTVLALRVVASIPVSLSANWIIRVTQVRSARDYQRAIRCSWLSSGGGACHGWHCRFPAHRFPVASGTGAYLCDVLSGSPTGGGLHVLVSEDTLHLLLSAW